jgi:hypothetical protein
MVGGVKGPGLPFVALLLAAAAVLPAAAHGQSSSLAVTTNKSVYDSNDRVIVAGTVSLDDNNNHNNGAGARFVTIKVTRDDVICGQQFVRVERDGSFVSRSMKVSSCGPGDYNVTATYGAQSATASFRIASKEPEQSNELAKIRDTVAQARDRANARIKELVQADISIPAQAVEKYQAGASEASLAIQSAEYGETASAHKHADAALAYFAETLDLLSPENMKALSQPDGAKNGTSNDNADDGGRLAAASDRYGRLTDIYRTLVGLAEKNGVNDTIFDDIQSLLVEGKRLVVDTRDVNSAESTLAVTESLLDKARVKLVEHAYESNSKNNDNDDNDDNDNSNNNSSNGNNDHHKVSASTSSTTSTTTDSSEGHNLSASADRLEKRAEKQLADAGGNAQAADLIHEAINLIGNARTAIGDGDYRSARESLSTASKALIDASRLVHSS